MSWRATHGMSGTSLHAIWKGMLCRCYSRGSTSYPNYGGRGVRVCHSWRDFENFYDDMAPTWEEGLTLERSDANGHYTPGNCCWKTRKEQGYNKRNNVRGEIKGEVYALAQALDLFGAVPYATAWARLRAGWSFSKAVTYPLR